MTLFIVDSVHVQRLVHLYLQEIADALEGNR